MFDVVIDYWRQGFLDYYDEIQPTESMVRPFEHFCKIIIHATGHQCHAMYLVSDLASSAEIVFSIVAHDVLRNVLHTNFCAV